MLKRRYLFIIIALFVLALIPSVLNSPVQAQIVGTNWSAQFFNNAFLTPPVVATASYPAGLCFNWGDGPPRESPTQCAPAATSNPIAGVDSDNFSARFTSTQAFTQSGNYTFTITVNDGVRVSINGVVVFDRFSTSVPTQQTAQYSFVHAITAGSANITVDYVDLSGTSALLFQWSPGTTGGGFPTATPIPVASVSVVQVRGLAVRTGPYLGASLITVARPNIAYPIIARNNSEGLFVWYRIQVGDNTGWASGRYLQPAGNLDEIPFTDSIFDRIDNPNLPPALDVIGTTRAIMNFRVRPSERVQITDKIPWGAQVKVIGRTIQGGKNFWLQVQWNGKVGWIFAPYIGLRGTIDAVPIY